MKLFTLQNACDGAYDSLDVRFTKTCDNNCAFCIEKSGLPAMTQDVDQMIKSTIKSDIKEVLILGGEPFLNPEKLLEYVRGIRNHVDKIYITTSLPSAMMSKSEEVTSIMQLIDGLNVSIQHTNWIINNSILNAISKHNRLELLSTLCCSWRDKIRVSINLVKGGIDSRVALENSFYDLWSLGVNNVKINELQNSSDLYVSYEQIMGVKLPSPYAHGCQTQVKFPLFEDMNVVLKRSCFMVENELFFGPMDILKMLYKRLIHKPKNKFMVLYENGSLKTGWEKHE